MTESEARYYMSKIKQPEIVSAQAWGCPCGGVNGIPEVDVCATCGEWTLDGPVTKPAGRTITIAPGVEASPPDEA